MDDSAPAGEEAPSDRLVALPRRRIDDGADLGDVWSGSPAAAVVDLLDRTNHLLHQLELDIDSLKEDQAKDRVRIEREAEERQLAADAAIDRLRELAFRARQIAERKARTEMLDQALAKKIELDKSISFDELVRNIEEEIRLAKGITGAIRLGTIGDLLKQATLHVEYLVKQAERSRARLLKETEAELHSEGKEARASYEIGMSVVRRDLKALDLALPPSGLAWDDPRWEHWEGWDPLSGVSRWVRFGTYYRPQLERFRFPALAELPGPQGFAIDVATGSREQAVDALRSTVLRLLASMPAGDCRFTFIDPTGLGESIAPFLPLGEFHKDLVDDVVCTQEDQIEAKLLEVTQHIERVIQDYLRGDFESIDAHNEAHGEIVEPYRFLVIFDFPTRFSDRSLQLVRNIIDNGPRCGVYTILSTAVGAARAHGARWKSMLTGLPAVSGDADGYWMNDELSGRWSVALDVPPPLTMTDAHGELSLFGRILTTTGERAREGRAVEVSMAKSFELLAEASRQHIRDDLPDVSAPVDPAQPPTWWSGSSQRGLGVPIGRSGTRDVTTLWIDSGARSGALVGGERGSGTSTLLHDAIAGLAMIYPPEELALYLVDCSPGGAGFEPYAIEGLPHARVVAVDTEREFAVSVLDGLVREMTRRAMLFAPHGGERAGIEGYRRETGEPLPRILLVVDEIDRLFSVNDRLGDRAAQLVDTLVRQGPSFGIHLLASAHGIGSLDRIGRHTFDEMRVRVALACSEDESRRLLGAQNGKASTFDRAGQAMLNIFDVDPSLAQQFQSTTIDRHERGVMLRDLRRLANEQGWTRQPQVFEGRAAARLEDSAIRQLAPEDGIAHVRLKPRMWLGEPCALGAPVEVTLRREPGANLLIVGRDDRLGQGLVVAALASAVIGHGSDLDVRIVDLMPLESGFGEVMQALSQASPVRVMRRRSLEDAITDVLAEVEKRIATQDFTAHPMIFVLNGLGQGPGFDDDASEGGFDPVRSLERIVREGPEVGVHTIVWSDRLPTIAAQTSRATMRAFALRAVMQMPAEDSAMLIDSAYASTLQDNQALLYDESASRLTKFRPYLIPTVDFVESLAATRLDNALATAH